MVLLYQSYQSFGVFSNRGSFYITFVVDWREWYWYCHQIHQIRASWPIDPFGLLSGSRSFQASIRIHLRLSRPHIVSDRSYCSKGPPVYSAIQLVPLAPLPLLWDLFTMAEMKKMCPLWKKRGADSGKSGGHKGLLGKWSAVRHCQTSLVGRRRGVISRVCIHCC